MLEDIYQFGVSDRMFQEIFGMSPILLLKDLGNANTLIYHETWSGNGFCYRRRNQELKSTELIAYAGYFGAHTDNPQYWVRERLPNSLLLRDALYLRWVCWFSIGTKIDKVPLKRGKTQFDVFVYHGCKNSFGLRNVPAAVKASLPAERSKEWAFQFCQESKTFCTQNKGKLVRTHLGRIDVSDLELTD